MKKTLLTAVVLVSLTVAAYADPVKTDAFSITLPEGFGEFTTQAQKTESPEGHIDTTNWIAKAASGEAVVVTVSTMPAPITDAGKAMDGMRESLLKSLNATLESEEKIDDGRAANLLFRSNGAFLRSKLLVDGDRMVQVLYVGRSEEQRAAAPVAELSSRSRPRPRPSDGVVHGRHATRGPVERSRSRSPANQACCTARPVPRLVRATRAGRKIDVELRGNPP